METLTLQRVVQAEPMTRLEYNEFRGWELPINENGADLGYKLTDKDNGHISWSPKEIVESEAISTKSLDNTSVETALKAVSDLEIWGDGNAFKLLSKASSKREAWMKSTKAMQCGNDVVIQVTTQQGNPDGSYSIAEALTTIVKARIVEVENDEGVVTSRHIEHW